MKPDFQKLYFYQSGRVADIIDQLQNLMLETEAMYIADGQAQDGPQAKNEPENGGSGSE